MLITIDEFETWLEKNSSPPTTTERIDKAFGESFLSALGDYLTEDNDLTHQECIVAGILMGYDIARFLREKDRNAGS